MGKRDRFIYKLYEGDKLVDQGLARDLAKRHNSFQTSLYDDWKRKQLFCRKYRVERDEVAPPKDTVYTLMVKIACELLAAKDKETGYDAKMWYGSLMDMAKDILESEKQ